MSHDEIKLIPLCLPFLVVSEIIFGVFGWLIKSAPLTHSDSFYHWILTVHEWQFLTLASFLCGFIAF